MVFRSRRVHFYHRYVKLLLTTSIIFRYRHLRTRYRGLPIVIRIIYVPGRRYFSKNTATTKRNGHITLRVADSVK